jgi:translation initiation factor 3 subunit E
MSKEDGEKWIVNLIRDTRADAKIDFKEVSFAARSDV